MTEWKKYWDEKIETMPRETLESLQLRLLKDELAFAYPNSSFYQTSFQEADVTPDSLKKKARPMIRFRTGDIVTATTNHVPVAERMPGSTSMVVSMICSSLPE